MELTLRFHRWIAKPDVEAHRLTTGWRNKKGAADEASPLERGGSLWITPFACDSADDECLASQTAEATAHRQ
jgi:hypothetical protein